MSRSSRVRVCADVANMNIYWCNPMRYVGGWVCVVVVVKLHLAFTRMQRAGILTYVFGVCGWPRSLKAYTRVCVC